MSYSEFPNTNYYDTDARELIALYKELNKNYAATLQSITDLSDKLTAYEKDVEGRIDAKCASAVSPLQTQVSSAIAGMQTKVDNAISTLSIKVNNEIADIRGELETAISRIDNVFARYDVDIDTRFSEMESSLNTKLNNYRVSMDTKFSQLSKSTREELTRMEESLNERLDSNFNTLTEYIKASELRIQTHTDETILDAVKTINSSMKDALEIVEGRISNLEQKSGELGIEYMWNEVYSLFGFTCKEWRDYTELTCEEWNNSNITCAQWFVNGKQILGYEKEQTKILSPLSGFMEYPEDILIDLAQKLNVAAITVEDFDNMKLTAEMYDKLHLTAMQYDWKGVYNVFRNHKNS